MKLYGMEVIDLLLGLAEGESKRVSGVEWTSLGESFEAATEYGEGDARFVKRDDIWKEFDFVAVYRVAG